MSQVTCGRPEFKVGLHSWEAQGQPYIYIYMTYSVMSITLHIVNT
jgi:hypothetical protein